MRFWASSRRLIDTGSISTQAIRGRSKFETHDKSEFTVEVKQVNSRKYFIQGEVSRSGAFPLLLPTTVLEALVNAGGFREFANTKKIIAI